MSALARAAISGVGMSDIGRNTNRPAILHLAEEGPLAGVKSAFSQFLEQIGV